MCLAMQFLDKAQPSTYSQFFRYTSMHRANILFTVETIEFSANNQFCEQ